MSTRPNIDDRVKLADIKMKVVQSKEIEIKLEIEQRRLDNEIRKIKIDELNQLGKLLESITIDEENKIKDFAFKQVFDEEETKLIKKTLVRKLKEL